MTKVAKLITVSLMTRVIVEEDATKDQIIEASKLNFCNKIIFDLGDNIEEIDDDEECPYGSVDGEEKIVTYEIRGYKTTENFNNMNYEMVDEGILTMDEALEDGEKLLNRFAVVKVQSTDREEISILGDK